MTTIRDALDRLWTASDDARMVSTGEGWWTWGDVRSCAERIDRQLGDAGCGPGGRVGVVLGNRAESVAALLAILRAGRTLVTVSPLQPPERIADDLAMAGWSIDGDAVTTRAGGTDSDPAVAIEMRTSGTTGPPKRIPLTYKQVEASLVGPIGRMMRSAPLTGDVVVITVPIVHIGGLWAVLERLVTAQPFALIEKFTVAEWHRAVTEHRPAFTALPPAALRSVLDADIPPDDLSSIRAINAGASPVDPDLVDAFHERYGIPVLILYGATEFTGSVAGWNLRDFTQQWKAKRGSVGRPFPGVALRVTDEDGAVVPAGTTGRLQIATARAGGEDWISTSDLAHVDTDGFLYIDGRADDVILRGGFKVSPDTVVNALRRHPSVADAAVVGLPDPRLGHVPHAAVELRRGSRASGDELRTHCRSLLTPYEVPVVVQVVDELPRGAAMKVDRRRLTEMLTPAQTVAGPGQESTHVNSR
ncbi:MAG: long-chain acyl-CoA synthetase [Mycobacterium sp.]|nr:long-chain acyl-CoA synthetase [Mycobacterium sp.]